MDLNKIPGVTTTYEPDCISFYDGDDESRAKMPCGHVFSSESMTSFLQSLISENKYEIRCPAELCNRL